MKYDNFSCTNFVDFKIIILFPLDRTCRLRCEIVEDTVYAFHLICNSMGYFVKHGVGDFFNCGTHSVGCIHCSDYCGPTLISAIVLDANAFDVGNGDKILPYLFSKATVVKLLSENGICLSQCFKSVTSDCTKTSYAETGTWEGLTVNHGVRKSKCFSYDSYFVLEEQL